MCYISDEVISVQAVERQFLLKTTQLNLMQYSKNYYQIILMK